MNLRLTSGSIPLKPFNPFEFKSFAVIEDLNGLPGPGEGEFGAGEVAPVPSEWVDSNSDVSGLEKTS